MTSISATPFQHTVKSLSQFIDQDLTASIQRNFNHLPRQISVCGILGHLKDDQYHIHYNIPLRDDADSVILDIRKTIAAAAGLKGGEYVSVVGAIKAAMGKNSNRIEIKIDVSAITAIDSPEIVASMQKDQMTISRLKALNPSRHLFPLGRHLKISVISSRSSQVQDDFVREMKPIEKLITVEKTYINLSDTNEIAQTIRMASCDILVVIRGGGDANQFEIFNKASILDAINTHPAYRVLGLGHDGDSTLSDLVCDYSASTPGQAGVHIREAIEKHELIVTAALKTSAQEAQAARSELDAAKVNLQRAIDESLDLKAQVSAKSAETSSLLDKSNSFIEMIIHHKKPVAITFAVAFILGIIASFLLFK